jgi:hypothetical protein
LDKLGHISADQLFADRVLQCVPQDRMDVLGHPYRESALTLVGEQAADVMWREPCELLLPKGRHQVHADDRLGTRPQL